MYEIYKWDEPLKVQMFGKIFLSYKGEEIPLGKGGLRLPMYVRFILLLWLRGEKGATVDEIVRYFYDGRDVRNQRNSVNNLLREANKKLREYGAPDADYFCRIGQKFRARPEVPVETDVSRFCGLIEKARSSKEEKDAIYKEAMECYKGPLLPEAADEQWAADEAAGLADMYREACDFTARKEISRGNVQNAAAVYEKACFIEPGGGWESRKVEILLRQGRDREAVQVYEHTIQRYLRSVRSVRTGKVLDCTSNVNERLLGFIQESDDVFFRIKEERGLDRTDAI